MPTAPHNRPPSDRAAWMRERGWGVFVHLLADSASQEIPTDVTPRQWNKRIDAFDVEAFAADLAGLGAGWVFLTTGQNSGFYLAPNDTYHQITGSDRLSHRDLMQDLGRACLDAGIRLGAYLPVSPPVNDHQACEKLGWRGDRERSVTYLQNWERVASEWSLQWGTLVSAWWIDHVHPWIKEVHFDHGAPNLATLAAAFRGGNPDAALAFNPGCRTQLGPWAPDEDFTSGELDYFLNLSGLRPTDRKSFNEERNTPGLVRHLLTFVGHWWGEGPRRLPPDLVRAYTGYVRSRGMVISWDVPVDHHGRIPPDCREALAAIGP